MQIELPYLSYTQQVVTLSTGVISRGVRRELWYSIPTTSADWFSTDRCDGFVVGLLLQAMERHEDMIVEGPLSSRLFHSLQGFFIPMMAQAFPNLHPITIIPASLTDAPTGGTGVATGFSGGIDSFAAVIQHMAQENSPDYRISHFLFHNVGSHGHGSPDNERKLFRQRFEHVKPFTDEIGIPIIPVDSNLAEILPIDFVHMHSILNASVPLVLQNQFHRYYYAAAYKYADCGVSWTDDIARFDPLAFHLLSTAGLDCVSTGCQITRVEKTRMVASYEPSRRYLNVCVDPAFEGRNCSVCFKCARTLLTLELLGCADAYQDVFDLDKFRQIRMKYLVKCLRYKPGSFEAEIAALIRQKSRGPLAQAFKFRHLCDRLAW